MDIQSSCNVLTNGTLKSGFNPEQVQTAVAELFRIPPEKAQAIVSKKVTIKKEVDIRTAHAYKKKLEALGLGIEIEQKQLNKLSLSLALEPTEEELQQQAAERDAPQPEPQTDSTRMVCPKCRFEQAKAPQCAGCGVYMHKVINQAPADHSSYQKVAVQRADASRDIVIEEQDKASLMPFVVAAVVAALGAMLWKFIAVEFDYELGLVAWLIGGAVGFSAAVVGSKGERAGIVCAMFTVAAIMGGKYMAYDEFNTNLWSALQQEVPAEVFQVAYEEELAAAEAYKDIRGDQSLRQFMVDYGYSEAYETNEVSASEVDSFKAEIEPDLLTVQANPPTFEQWMDIHVNQELAAVSTWQLMQENFGILDLVFLLLGVATAFRLASQQHSTSSRV